MNIMGFGQAAKVQKYVSWDLRFLLQAAKVAKSMICAFCAKRQKWQKYESWDLRFLRQAAKVAKKYDLRFLRQEAKVAKV